MRRKYLFLIVITLALTISIWKTQDATAEDDLNKGELVKRTTDGYNWWCYIPESLEETDHTYIWMENSHPSMENYEQLTADAKLNAQRFTNYAEQTKYILVTIALPRIFNEDYYPQGINYYSLHSETPEFYYRPDLKANHIIDELLNLTENAGYSVNEKILVSGYSAGGMWANKYTLLHPDRVMAAAIGQGGGWLAMPISEFNDTLLNWPLGINDFENLTGAPYEKQEILKNVPQYIFMGSEDNYHTHFAKIYPKQEDVEIWGEFDTERIENQSNYLIDNGYTVEFTLYAGLGHEYTSTMINDYLEFFEAAIKRSSIPGYPLGLSLAVSVVMMIALVTYYHRKLLNIRIKKEKN